MRIAWAAEVVPRVKLAGYAWLDFIPSFFYRVRKVEVLPSKSLKCMTLAKREAPRRDEISTTGVFR